MAASRYRLDDKGSILEKQIGEQMYGIEAITNANGITLMVVGMVVVFIALLLLIVLMTALRYVQNYLHAIQQRKESGGLAPAAPEDIPALVVAAIALTLILEEESVHDQESLVLTLHSLPKPYSNWWMSEIGRSWSTSLPKGQLTLMGVVDPIRGKVV